MSMYTYIFHNLFCSHKTSYVVITRIVVTDLRAIDAGKMNPMHTAVVAPVNWKASQMLGMKFAAKKTTELSPIVIQLKRTLSESKGVDVGKRRASKFKRRG